MKRTENRKLPQRRLQLASETLRRLTAMDLTRVHGGAEDDNGKNPTTRTVGSARADCTAGEEPSICVVC